MESTPESGSDAGLSEKQREGIWKKTYWHLRRSGSRTQAEAMHEATRRLEEAHGPGRKLKGTKPPWPARVAVWWVGKQLAGLRPLEVSMLQRKILTAVVFGIGAIAVGLQAALSDGSISGAEWPAIISAFVVAAWGKFSSNTTFISPSRAGETVDGPK